VTVADPFIRVETAPVSRVILSRPQARNAMGAETLELLEKAFLRLGSDPVVRCVVVSAEGKDFCAGADIEWMRAGGKLSAAEGRRDARRFADMLRAVDSCPVPVVVAAAGAVFGGGLGLLAACDIALIADDAKLCFSEVRLGIMPAVISCWVLPKIGPANARRWYLSAETFGAPQAVAMGLAREVVPAAELGARADAVAASILRNGPRAVRDAKAAIPRLAAASGSDREEMALDLLVGLRSSSEGQEGLSAFLEKRPPSWVPKT
jgi:methylglutaconyl-CoA hydratase